MDARPNLCPCCGQPVIVSAWDAALADLSPMQRRIAEIVARRPGMSSAALADAVYARASDGGPLWAEKSVQSAICHANKKLRPHRLAIGTLTGRRKGYQILAVAP